jgi:hypothetical protein
MKKTTMYVAVVACLMVAMVSVSNAAITSYAFTGSNTPQSGEVAGTMAGTFTLDVVGAGTVALDNSDVFSWEYNHDGNNNTFSSDGAGTSTVAEFNTGSWYVTVDASANVTNINFDGDYIGYTDYLAINWDSSYTNAAGSRNSGADNRFNYDGGLVFLDNVTVTQVPEPGSLALLGLSGLALLRRRRR